MLRVVDGKFGGVEVLVPIRLLEVDVGPEEFFQGSVRTFGLTVGLRMVGGTHGQGGSELSPKGTPEVGGEARISVAEDDLRNSVQSHDLPKEEFGELGSSHGGLACNIVDHLGQLADEYHDGIVARAGAGKRGDEIHAHPLPGPAGDGKRSQQAHGRLERWFVPLAGVTALDVEPHGGIHARPVKSTLDLFQGLFDAQMPSGGGVVAFLEDACLESLVGGDPEAVVEIQVTSSNVEVIVRSSALAESSHVHGILEVSLVDVGEESGQRVESVRGRGLVGGGSVGGSCW